MTDAEMREIYVQECVKRQLLASDEAVRAYEPIAAAMRRAYSAGWSEGAHRPRGSSGA